MLLPTSKSKSLRMINQQEQQHLIAYFFLDQVDERVIALQYRLMAGGGGGGGAERPKLTWKKLTEKECREWKLTTVDTQERTT